MNSVLVLVRVTFYMRTRIFFFILTIFLVLSFNVSGQNSTIKEESRSILTYPFSDPNPVAPMAISSMVSPFYPYYEFDGYTNKGVNKEWKVITLENEFISVTILPEVGGKVWGAIEKSTGREFIYQNHVLKFRAIGIRGPWTSGGIEHNFGLDLGHAPWTASPVDYIINKNDDGSVSCVVGGLDLASRTQWRVKIELPADKAYFKTESMWYNPTPVHDAYLSWENAGFKASDDLQFYFPGEYYIGHDGSVNPWPLDKEGRDLSQYKANNFGTSKSYHVSGLYTGWFGGYWNNSDFGFAHYAPYSDAPGKKIWIWSLARDGAIWEDLLTDSDGQYIEAQSGVKFNQANRESGYDSPYNQLSMRPYYTDTKTEYWFPVVKTKGIADASPAGTLNIIPSKDSIKLIICPNSEINDSLVMTINGDLFYSSFIKLKPLQIYQKSIYHAGDNKDNIVVRIGKNLLRYNSDKSEIRLDRPIKSTENKDFKSAEHLFMLAEDMNAMRDYDQALKYYLDCLQKEPAQSRALYKVAELYYKRADYEEALKFARRILEINTYDGPGNFIYGVVLRSLGKLNQAEETFSVAARTMEFRSAACLQISEIKSAKKDFSGAVTYAGKSLDYNRYNISALENLASSYRKLNNSKECSAILEQLLETDPLNHFARFEKYLLDPTPENLGNVKNYIRNELPHETYLELAVSYTNKGLDEEAIRVLEQAPPYPTVYYWLASLYRNTSPEKSSSYLQKAVDMSPYLVFPFRTETIPVLTWAMEKNDSWKTKYYLGLIYWHIHRDEKAGDLFEQCGDIPDFAPFYLARGTLFQSVQSNYCHPCSDFSQAVKLDPNEWRTWHFLSNFLQANSSFTIQLENSKEAFRLFPANPVIGTDYAKALLNSAKYTECLKVLEGVNILPQEGAHEGHDIFELANLSIAAGLLEQKKYKEVLSYLINSEKWPENLGAGKPYEPDTRFQDYISAYCYKMTGNQKLADNYATKIMEFSLLHPTSDFDISNICISNMIFNDYGRSKEYDYLMHKWITEQDSLRDWNISGGSSSPKAKWVIARYLQDEEKSVELEKEILSAPAENRFRLYLRVMNIINTRRNEK